MRLQLIIALVIVILFNVESSLAKLPLEKQNVKENVLKTKVGKSMSSTKRINDDDDDGGGQDDVPIGVGLQQKHGKVSKDSSKFSNDDYIWAICGVFFGVAIIVGMASIAIFAMSKSSSKESKRKSNLPK